MSDNRKTIRARSDAVLREEDEGAFLFDPETGRVCFLNDVGKSVWRLCGNNRSPLEVVDKVCEQFPEIPKERIAEDCEKFFSELERLALVAKENPA